MQNKYTLFRMTDEEIKAYPFLTADGKAGFYRFVGERIAPYDSITSIDCTKVNVATNIQEEWFDYAKHHGIASADLSMALLMSGPKALETLQKNYVELEEGAITYGET